MARGVSGRLELVEAAAAGEDALVAHDAARQEPSLAFELPPSERPTGPTPIGVFRDVERPVYGEQLALELEQARADGIEQLEALLHAERYLDRLLIAA